MVMFSGVPSCPLCKKESQRENPLQPVFTFSRNDIENINPMFPDANHLHVMFKTGQVEDLAYCIYGHGLLSLKTGKKLIHI